MSRAKAALRAGRQISRCLERIGWAGRRVRFLEQVCWITAGGLAGLLVVAWADLIMDLSRLVRWSLGLMVVGGVGGGWGLALRDLMRGRGTQSGWAVRIERAMGWEDNVLVNAAELWEGVRRGKYRGLTEWLAERAVIEGARRCGVIDRRAVVPVGRLKKAGGALAAAMLVWGVVGAMAPGWAADALVRWSGTKEPGPVAGLSRLALEVRSQEKGKRSGLKASVRVEGRELEGVKLVAQDRQSGVTVRWDMRRASGREFEYWLEGVGQGIVLWAEAEGVRSRRIQMRSGETTGGATEVVTGMADGESSAERLERGQPENGGVGEGEGGWLAERVGAGGTVNDGRQDGTEEMIRSESWSLERGEMGEELEGIVAVQSRVPAVYREVVARYLEYLAREERR